MSDQGIWSTPGKLDRLREEWAAGTPTEEIGRRLGVSKNAVVGKAHRLDLPSRPSPIKRIRDGQSFRAAFPGVIERAAASTLPALASEQDAPLPAEAPRASPADIRRSNAILLGKAARDKTPTLPPLSPDAPRPLIVAAEPRPASPVPRSSGDCCWLLGEQRPFRACDAPAAGRGPYCDEHAKLAFVKIRDRREPEYATMGGDD